MRPIDTSSLLRVDGTPAAARLRAVLAALVLCATLAPGLATAEPFRGHLRIIVPSAPGGGFDVVARAMQAALQSSGLAQSVSVENIPGGGGTIALANLVSAERGRGDVIMVSGMAMLMTTISYGSPLTLRDVTPIARLTSYSDVVTVAATSPFQTFDDFIQAFRAQPESISWTGGFAGGPDHTLAWLIADAAGVDPRRVNFVGASGGESSPVVAGGHVSVGLGPVEALRSYVRSGTMRALAVSSGERDPSLDVPTLREHGLDVVFEGWRVLLAPPGVSAADRQRLEALLATLAGSPAWQQALAQYTWRDNFLAGPALDDFIQTEDQRIRRLFRRLGSDQRASTSSLGPYALLVFGGLVATALVMAVIRGFRPSLVRPTARGRAAFLLMAGGVLVNLALIDAAGFVLASTALFWLTAHAFDSNRPWRHAMFALGLSVVAYVLFAQLLDVTLPPGVIGKFVSRSI